MHHKGNYGGKLSSITNKLLNLLRIYRAPTILGLGKGRVRYGSVVVGSLTLDLQEADSITRTRDLQLHDSYSKRRTLAPRQTNVLNFLFVLFVLFSLYCLLLTVQSI